LETIQFEHPLARSLLTEMRDRRTTPDRFRALAYRLGFMLAVEATREIETVPVSVDTPLETIMGEKVAEPPVLVPVMRAGLGLLPPFLELIPGAETAFVAVRRDEETGEPRWLYDSSPDLAGRNTIVLDPMLATGGTAKAVVNYVFEKGTKHVTLVSITAAPRGLEALVEYENLTIITVSVDRELNADLFILPGLGDFGDRLFGRPGKGSDE